MSDGLTYHIISYDIPKSLGWIGSCAAMWWLLDLFQPKQVASAFLGSISISLSGNNCPLDPKKYKGPTQNQLTLRSFNIALKMAQRWFICPSEIRWCSMAHHSTTRGISHYFILFPVQKNHSDSILPPFFMVKSPVPQDEASARAQWTSASAPQVERHR